MFCLAALLAFDPFSRGLRFAAIPYSVVGVGFSIYFMYLQIEFIHAFCIYCLASAVTTVLLLIAACWHLRATLVGPASTVVSDTGYAVARITSWRAVAR
jgi:uncharacterized membrane protein